MRSILNRIERYYEFKTKVYWFYAFNVLMIFLITFYGFYLIPSTRPITTISAIFAALVSATAVSAGAHRLWSHKSYKAKLPMRIIIMLCYMMAGQYSIVTWVRDHRTHHKYTDTDADPHSVNRGLLFSHCGWHMMKRHPEYKEKSKVIDLSDVWSDPVIRFHQKYYLPLLVGIHIIFPSAFIYYVIGDTLKNAIIFGLFMRYAISLNLSWSINSLAHFWGYRPYNKNIKATQNIFLAFILLGEGWHNYHHTFPWDYRNGQAGHGYMFTASVIDAFAWLGLAYDLKTASPEIVQKVLDKQRNLPKNYEVPEAELTEKVDAISKEIKTA